MFSPAGREVARLVLEALADSIDFGGGYELRAGVDAHGRIAARSHVDRVHQVAQLRYALAHRKHGALERRPAGQQRAIVATASDARVETGGIQPEVAQSMVGLGIDFAGILSLSTLRDGLSYCMDALGPARNDHDDGGIIGA